MDTEREIVDLNYAINHLKSSNQEIYRTIEKTVDRIQLVSERVGIIEAKLIEIRKDHNL